MPASWENISRHLRSKHGIEPDDYDGMVKSESCKRALSKASLKAWDSRERKVDRDKSNNKTHKVNGLNEVELRKLYVEEGLSDAKIGAMFDMTGEGVAYRRKKWGIMKTLDVVKSSGQDFEWTSCGISNAQSKPPDESPGAFLLFHRCL